MTAPLFTDKHFCAFSLKFLTTAGKCNETFRIIFYFYNYRMLSVGLSVCQ